MATPALPPDPAEPEPSGEQHAVLGRARSVEVLGVAGLPVEVQVALAEGLPQVRLVGLPDAAVSESLDRVRAALVSGGYGFPRCRVVVSMVPAELRKSGSRFDLPIAVAVLAASGALPRGATTGVVLVGELALDGALRHVTGVLPSVLAARDAGAHAVLVPLADAAEASLVPGVAVWPAASLREAVALLQGVAAPRAAVPGAPAPVTAPAAGLDLADVRGQETGRLGVAAAAAGGHHLLLQGPPGCGKTMLVERLGGLLPDLDDADAVEVTAVHSVLGALPLGTPLLRRPPVAAPHPTATVAALVGGGSGTVRPGAVTAAHRGVLLLDEACEFSGRALEALRGPLETGHVTVARASGSTTYPARFVLAMATNTCPCGRSPGGADPCRCSASARLRYQARLSRAVRDRVDVQLSLEALTAAERARSGATTTAEVRAMVLRARAAQAERYAGTPWRLNGEVPGHQLRARWPLPRDAERELQAATTRLPLSERGLGGLHRLAWTLADLDGDPAPRASHVAAAQALRGATAPAQRRADQEGADERGRRRPSLGAVVHGGVPA